MKKIFAGLLTAMLLAGCASGAPELETMAAVLPSGPQRAAAREIGVWVPEEAEAEVMAGDVRSYRWKDCEIRVRTLDGGDIRRTVEELTGMKYENLTVMGRRQGDLQLYQTVWCSAGEESVLLGRAIIADDGAYHYCVTLTAPENDDTREIYSRMVRTMAVISPDSKK